MNRQTAHEPAIFSDQDVRRVFDYVVANGVFLDEDIEKQIDLPSARIRAILSAFKGLELVDIKDTLDRGSRIVHLTPQGMILARGLHNK